jgi:hypothetical protein
MLWVSLIHMLFNYGQSRVKVEIVLAAGGFKGSIDVDITSGSPGSLPGRLVSDRESRS